MKTIDFNDCGLQEIKREEGANINGGFWYLILGAVIGAALTQDLDSLGASAKQGWKAAAR